WSVAMTHTNLGTVLSAGPATRWQEAEGHFNKAAEWYKPAYERDPGDLELVPYWATNRAELASLKARQAFAAAAPPDAAVNLYAEAISILEKAKESQVGRPLLAECLLKLGAVQRRGGQPAKAETALTRAQDVLRGLLAVAPQGPSVAVLRAQ